MNECVICFEKIKKYQKIVKCKICSNKFHKTCYKRWNNIKNDNKCICCMSKNTIIKLKTNKNIKKSDYHCPDCCIIS